MKSDSIRAEIDEILRSPVDEQSTALAHSIVSNQFEDLIGEPFYTAIESLSATDKIRLYTIAALGAPAYGLTNDFLLTELVQSGDRAALPALEHWATHLDSEGFYQTRIDGVLSAGGSRLRPLLGRATETCRLPDE